MFLPNQSQQLERLHPGLRSEHILLNPHPFCWLAILDVYTGFLPFPARQKDLQRERTHRKIKNYYYDCCALSQQLAEKTLLNTGQQKEKNLMCIRQLGVGVQSNCII